MIDTSNPEELQRQIAVLQEQLAAIQAQQQAQSLHAAIEATFTVNERNYGQQVAINLGTMIYGRDPREDEQRQLIWYLDTLAAKLNQLSLHGLATQLVQRGAGVALSNIYVMVATQDKYEVAKRENESFLTSYIDPSKDLYDLLSLLQNSNKAFIDLLQSKYQPDWGLPAYAITGGYVEVTEDEQYHEHGLLCTLTRSLLATEAVQKHHRLVLLGHPGSGKSTFLRHLAWTLARRELGYPVDDDILPHKFSTKLPVILSLRKLAATLANGGTVFSALTQELEACDLTDVVTLLREALHSGVALLLFDGLDEVPIAGNPDQWAARLTTLQAVHEFAKLHLNTPIVLTCRERAFSNDLCKMIGWPVATLAPFTMGQVRHFVPAWYTELVAKGHLEHERAASLTEMLIQAIVERPRLHEMAATPLLLTMMALVLYNCGELPRDRPQLYEAILALLLGQWDRVHEGHSLAEVIGHPDWNSERIRPVLDQLSYDAHLNHSSKDGRGRLDRWEIHKILFTALENDGMDGDKAAGAAVRCLDYIEQRSGLLLPDGKDSFVFAHLTLQEHGAGRALMLDRDPITLVLNHRADDRWHEPIFLGLGVVQQANPFLIESVLGALIDRDEHEVVKPSERWYRDLILAAEIGKDRDWGYLRQQKVNVGSLLRNLKSGLVTLLNDKAQPLPAAERVRAGFLLGDLGDPRIPVTIEEWQQELVRVQAGDTSGYFCPVAAGTYIIGSAVTDLDARPEEQPQHQIEITEPYLIARYPITNEQWQAWVKAGGMQSYDADSADFNSRNQPVVGVDWHMCNAFCVWLSTHLCVSVRLPNEYEWEAAARGGDDRCYPWGNTWQEDRAATKEDQVVRKWRYTVPVGCYPAGKAPCGALDMAGNVWEWTADIWQAYPNATKPFIDKNLRVLRGGAHMSDKTGVRCGARVRNPPLTPGFRIRVAYVPIE